MPKLFAIADIHIGHGVNKEELKKLKKQPAVSGLILAGDVGETIEHLEEAFTVAKQCFDHVFWVPGNHELYTTPRGEERDRLKGEPKYMAQVEFARKFDIHTPEDPWIVWNDDDGNSAIIALCFTLYDYSFRPAHISRQKALDWAQEQDTYATDEALVFPEPYLSRDAWCHVLCDRWENKFREYSKRHPGVPFVIVNHWPLRRDLVYIPLIPRFSLWCGTTRTANWHKKGYFGESYPGAIVVVSGHLHVRRTDYKDDCRFEECSLGYPHQWEAARTRYGKNVNGMLREILPNNNTGAPFGSFRTYG